MVTAILTAHPPLGVRLLRTNVDRCGRRDEIRGTRKIDQVL